MVVFLWKLPKKNRRSVDLLDNIDYFGPDLKLLLHGLNTTNCRIISHPQSIVTLKCSNHFAIPSSRSGL